MLRLVLALPAVPRTPAVAEQEKVGMELAVSIENARCRRPLHPSPSSVSGRFWAQGSRDKSRRFSRRVKCRHVWTGRIAGLRAMLLGVDLGLRNAVLARLSRSRFHVPHVTI